MYNKKKLGKLIYPLVKATINVPTVGFGGAIMEIFEIPYNEQRREKIDNFIKQTIKKINELDLKISEVKFKKRIQKPEFIQLFIKILLKIEHENRKEIRQSYSNLLTNLVKENVKINFNQKIFFLDILETLNEDHIKILSTFYKNYKNQTVKNKFSLKTLHGKIELNALKDNYLESLLSDLNGKKIIKIKTEIESEPDVEEKNGKITAVNVIDNYTYEEYVGTELGYQFYRFIIEYK